jgi:TonB family protein
MDAGSSPAVDRRVQCSFAFTRGFTLHRLDQVQSAFPFVTTTTSPQTFLVSVAAHAVVAALLLLVSRAIRPAPNLDSSRFFELVAHFNGKIDSSTTSETSFAPDLQLNVPALHGSSGETAQIESKPPERASRSVGVIATPPATKISSQLSKEEFDRMHPPRPSSNSSRPNGAHVDPTALAKNLLSNPTGRSTSTAQGNSLTCEQETEIAHYLDLLRQRLKEQVDRSARWEPGLVAEVELHIMADGQLARARILTPSTNDRFDQAVLQAIASVHLSLRPKGLSELQEFPFVTQE